MVVVGGLKLFKGNFNLFKSFPTLFIVVIFVNESWQHLIVKCLFIKQITYLRFNENMCPQEEISTFYQQNSFMQYNRRSPKSFWLVIVFISIANFNFNNFNNS